MDRALDQSLGEAIRVLFSSPALSSPEQKNSANAFILEVLPRPEVFPALLQILLSPAQEAVVKFFASNLLCDKVRKQWVQLNEAEQEQVVQQSCFLLRSAVSLPDNSDAQAYRSRLVLVCSSACLRSAGGLLFYLSIVDDLLQQNSLSTLFLSLEMLTQLNEETEAVDLSRTVKSDLQTRLQIALPRYLAHLQQVLVSTGCPHNLIAAGLGYLASCLRSRLLTGLTLFQDYPTCFEVLLRLLVPQQSAPSSSSQKASGNWNLLQKAFEAVREIAVMRDYPPSAQGAQVMDSLAQGLAQSLDHLLVIYPSAIHWDEGFLRCLTEVNETVVVLLHGQLDAFMSSTGPSSSLLQLTHKWMQLLVLRPRSLVMLTFDFWSEAENFSQEEREPFFIPTLMPPLCRLLLRHASLVNLSPEDLEEVIYDEEEDLETFRDLRLGLDDLLLSLWEAQPVNLLQLLAEHYRLYRESAAREESWYHLEVVLFILQALMSRIKDNASQPGDLNTFLLELALTALHHPVTNQKSSLQAREVMTVTICKYLGSITFLLTTTKPQAVNGTEYLASLYRSALQFTLHYACGPRGEVSLAAAKAFHKLSVHGQWLMLKERSAQGHLLEECIRFFVQNFNPQHYLQSSPTAPLDKSTSASCVFESSGGLVVEGLSRAIARETNLVLSTAWLTALFEPVTEGIQAFQYQVSPSGSSLQSISTRSADIVEIYLAYASQAIRFCDVLPTAPQGHILLPALTSLWPLLQNLFLLASSQAMARAISRVFEIFGRVLQSLGSDAMTQLPHIIAQIVQATDQRAPFTPAALDCSIVAIDYIGNHVSDENERRRVWKDLIFPVLRSFHNHFAGNPVFASPAIFVDIQDHGKQTGYDLEALDSLGRLLLATLTSPAARWLVLEDSFLELMLPVIIAIMRCSAEKDPLRNIHGVLQAIYSPARLVLLLDSSGEKQKALLQKTLPWGGQVFTLLVNELSSSRLGSYVISNVADALQAVIVGYHADHSAQCQAWLMQAICSEASLSSAFDASLRQKVLQMVYLSAVHQNRRFKAIIQDIYKVCCAEATIDVLVGYEDILSFL
eukprot:scaffold455_cov155-Ochromonas_danica.AAC.3